MKEFSEWERPIEPKPYKKEQVTKEFLVLIQIHMQAKNIP